MCVRFRDITLRSDFELGQRKAVFTADSTLVLKALHILDGIYNCRNTMDGETEVAFRSLIRGLSKVEVGDDDKMGDLKKNASILQKKQLLEKYSQKAVDLGCLQPTSPLYVLPVDLSEVYPLSIS